MYITNNPQLNEGTKPRIVHTRKYNTYCKKVQIKNEFARINDRFLLF